MYYFYFNINNKNGNYMQLTLILIFCSTRFDNVEFFNIVHSTINVSNYIYFVIR